MDTEIYTKLKKAIDNRLYTISDVFDLLGKSSKSEYLPGEPIE